MKKYTQEEFDAFEYENLADHLISNGMTVREFGHWKYDFNLASPNDMDWDMIIAHPPCTDLSISGARHFARKKADGSQRASIADWDSLDDDENFCEECKANGDDYYLDEDGELECYCSDCYRMKMEDEWNDE